MSEVDIRGMKDELEHLRRRALEELKVLGEGAGLDEFRIKYLGRKGELAQAFKKFKTLAEAERPKIGTLLNQVKLDIEQAFNDITTTLKGEGTVDVTALPGALPEPKATPGHLHPVSIVQRELEELFRSMGFMVLDGPELESEYYNFEALNIPSWHPAREMHDTIYVKGGEPDNRWLLRTHTSAMQVRALKQYGVPIRALMPGRVFRHEATDASHETTFAHVEGLVVDKDISVSNLVAVMKELLKGIFHREVEIRLRPGYFPFTEPGFELDIKCLVCGGPGCSVCKQKGWVELIPCGLVHPRVLEYGGIDPKEYSGFAFGLGLSRLVMMRYKIDDVRLLLGGDLKFLEQF